MITIFIAGLKLYFGEGVRKNRKEAVKNFIKAAKLGSIEACFMLGEIYGLEKKGLKWFRQAVKGGNPVAQLRLGWKYFFGKGVRKNRREALFYFRLAADQGLPEAMRSLASMYITARGRAKNYTEAVKWLLLAQIAGDKTAFAEISALREKMTKEEIKTACRGCLRRVLLATGTVWPGRSVMDSPLADD